MIEEFLNKITPCLENPIECVFDIGSRDGLQSIEFSKRFPSAKIYAFEANPESIETCLQNTKDYPNITLVPKACLDFDGRTAFYAIDMEKSPIKNIGASSCFPISNLYKSRENLLQKTIEVPCCRLDTFMVNNNIDKVDLLWIDAEGSEICVIWGMGDKIKTVRAIYVETTFKPLYYGNRMFEDVHWALFKQGFRLIYKPQEEFRGDLVYINSQKEDMNRFTIDNKW